MQTYADRLHDAEQFLDRLLTDGPCPESMILAAYEAECALRDKAERTESERQRRLGRKIVRGLGRQWGRGGHHIPDATPFPSARHNGKANVTTCCKGHPFNYTEPSTGQRRCRICMNDKLRRYRAKRRMNTCIANPSE